MKHVCNAFIGYIIFFLEKINLSELQYMCVPHGAYVCLFLFSVTQNKSRAPFIRARNQRAAGTRKTKR